MVADYNMTLFFVNHYRFDFYTAAATPWGP
jgi:hypothetical protein